MYNVSVMVLEDMRRGFDVTIPYAEKLPPLRLPEMIGEPSEKGT